MIIIIILILKQGAILRPPCNSVLYIDGLAISWFIVLWLKVFRAKCLDYILRTDVDAFCHDVTVISLSHSSGEAVFK